MLLEISDMLLDVFEMPLDVFDMPLDVFDMLSDAADKLERPDRAAVGLASVWALANPCAAVLALFLLLYFSALFLLLCFSYSVSLLSFLSLSLSLAQS